MKTKRYQKMMAQCAEHDDAGMPHQYGIPMGNRKTMKKRKKKKNGY